MTALRAAQLALLVADDRDAAAADRDDDVVVHDQRADGVDLLNGQRLGRGDHPPPAAPGVFDHLPAVLLEAARFFLGHEAADRLGRVLRRPDRWDRPASG